MFDLYDSDRLTEWKRFRTHLETSQTPFEDVAEFWSRAPFVSSYLDPQDPQSWPDPWHLILDDKLDDLAICLGMLYTIKLTQRFIDSCCEIHMTMFPKKKDPKYFLLVDGQYLLNDIPKQISSVEKLHEYSANRIWIKNTRV